VSDDRAPIPKESWPAGWQPFSGVPKSPEERAEWARLLREKEASRSAPPPDKPDIRTNTQKPSNDAGSDVRKATRTTPGQTPVVALETDILGVFLTDLRRTGVAGEERLAQLEYLALTSRVLPWGRAGERPISIFAKGTTSTGKSFTTTSVLRFFPPAAYIDLGSMSRRFLFYDAETYSHRFLIVPEWASISEDDELVALLRTLLSEGRIIHGTVDRGEKGEGRQTARRIEKAGPTGLLITTTEAAVDAEMETRCLSLTTDDTPEQTRRVFAATAAQEFAGETVDLERWHDLQLWIGEEGETRVLVPFVEALAALMPSSATRLRRDFVSLLCLVRAHAILYQAQRERDALGRIVATVEGDYAPVRELVGDVIAEGVEASVTPAMRATVEAAQALLDEGKAHVSPKALTDHLGVGRSATYDRIRRALLKGYLVNEAGKDERGMKLVLGSPLPGADEFLPSPAEVVRHMSGTPIRTSKPHEQVGSERLSGSPGLPPHPPDERLPESEGKSLPPGLGDDMFPVLLADAARDGHITANEFEKRYALHKLVLGEEKTAA
jgi:hypothetical protein